MSRQPENTFIASVRRHLPKDLYVVKNNNQYHAGIPDLWISGKKSDLWIEAKFIAPPKRGDTIVSFGLSHLQQHWLASRHAEGRSVGVLIGSKAGGVWIPGVSWALPLSAAQFAERMLDRKQLASLITRLVS